MSQVLLAQVETLELRTNVIAAYVCGGHADKVPETAAAMQIAPGDSSDIGFNMACALLQLRAFGDAEQQLQLALRTGAALTCIWLFVWGSGVELFLVEGVG